MQVAPATRRNGLAKHLIQILTNIEHHVDDRRLCGDLNSLPKSNKEALKKVDVVYARPYCSDGSCSGLTIGTPDIGGDVDHAGEQFCRWIGPFLASLDDVLKKLQLARAAERHAFVPVAFGGAP